MLNNPSLNSLNKGGTLLVNFLNIVSHWMVQSRSNLEKITLKSKVNFTTQEKLLLVLVCLASHVIGGREIEDLKSFDISIEGVEKAFQRT